MQTGRWKRNRGGSEGVWEALLAHIGIRRAEGVDADDLRSEVRKWWDWNDLPDPSDDVLSEIISSGQLLARAERSANRRAVRTGTPIASLGGSA